MSNKDGIGLFIVNRIVKEGDGMGRFIEIRIVNIIGVIGRFIEIIFLNMLDGIGRFVRNKCMSCGDCIIRNGIRKGMMVICVFFMIFCS